MSNSILSNDFRLTSLEVTDYLKIPTCTDVEIRKNIGKEGEIKFNISTNSLMIRTPNEWKKIALKPYDTKPSAPPPPYPEEDTKKTMRVKVEKKAIIAEFLDIIEPMIFQQIKFLLEESRRLKMRIFIHQNNSDKLIKYLHETNVIFNTDEYGNISIENF